MTHIFSTLTTDNLEDAGDSLGGGGAVPSKVYDATIKVAYLGKAKSGANSLTVVADIGNREYRETIYFTSGDSKGGKHYYERDGKKYPLPGFTTVNDIALLATGKDLSQQTMEEKVVKLYDYDAGKELPTQVTVVSSLTGQKVKLGIVRIRENKTKKNDSTGAYEPINEERLINNISKVFHADTGKTVTEYQAKSDTAEFLPKWKEKHDGNDVDKYKEVTGSGKSGLPGGASGGSSNAPASGSSLFG